MITDAPRFRQNRLNLYGSGFDRTFASPGKPSVHERLLNAGKFEARRPFFYAAALRYIFRHLAPVCMPEAHLGAAAAARLATEALFKIAAEPPLALYMCLTWALHGAPLHAPLVLCAAVTGKEQEDDLH